MLTRIANITKIAKLYVQLLYKCNFNCQHCFHGERLKWKFSYSHAEVASLLKLFISDYNLRGVTFLGGEPFLHPEICSIVESAAGMGLVTEICTNGFRVSQRLATVADNLDHLRVSLEGLKSTNDEIRHPGSFAAAIETIQFSLGLGIKTSITLTVNSKNIAEVVPLIIHLSDVGVTEFKLHKLRCIGNAATRPWLEVNADKLNSLHDDIAKHSRALAGLRILLDEDLDPTQCTIGAGKTAVVPDELERVELQPTGELYVSCKAVGNNSNAFWYDKARNRIDYRPHGADEITTRVRQVHYQGTLQ